MFCAKSNLIIPGNHGPLSEVKTIIYNEKKQVSIFYLSLLSFSWDYTIYSYGIYLNFTNCFLYQRQIQHLHDQSPKVILHSSILILFHSDTESALCHFNKKKVDNNGNPKKKDAKRSKIKI